MALLQKKYYKAIEDLCRERNIFSYELESDSNAEKVFRNTETKNSLMLMKNKEAIAFKELLITLCNFQKVDGLTRYIRSIPALDIDPALFNEYLAGISKGRIPQGLIDEVEHHYEEDGHLRERIDLVDAIGNRNALFYSEYDYAVNMIWDILNNRAELDSFLEDFPQQVEDIGDSEFSDEAMPIIALCERLKNQKIGKEDFLSELHKEYELLASHEKWH